MLDVQKWANPNVLLKKKQYNPDIQRNLSCLFYF